MREISDLVNIDLSIGLSIKLTTSWWNFNLVCPSLLSFSSGSAITLLYIDHQYLWWRYHVYKKVKDDLSLLYLRIFNQAKREICFNQRSQSIFIKCSHYQSFCLIKQIRFLYFLTLIVATRGFIFLRCHQKRLSKISENSLSVLIE